MATYFDVFSSGYDRAALKRAQETSGYSVETADAEYLSGLAWAPFSDSGAVVGGAIKILQERGVETEPADVLENSLGLLAVASVDKENLTDVYQGFGVPYTDARFLEIINSDGGETPQVRFKSIVRTNLKDMYGKGCPANRMQQLSTTGTMLQTYWKSITRYLAPPEATIDRYRPRIG